MSATGGVRCHLCGKAYATKEFYPACSEDHLNELRLTCSRPEDTPLGTARKDAEILAKQDKIKLWVKYINHSYAARAALFELITGFKPPKMKDVAALISGHK